MKDWQSNDITKPEQPSDKILVWSISPHPYDSSCDSMVVRSFQDAVKEFRDAIEHLMDAVDENDLKESGINIKIELVEMTISEYLDLQEK